MLFVPPSIPHMVPEEMPDKTSYLWQPLPEASAEDPPTITASAYTNSTSPTGRTLSLSGHVSDGSVYWLDHIHNGAPFYEALGYDKNLTQFYFSILKDNTVVLPSGSSSIWFFEFSGDTALFLGTDTMNSGYNLPIPADWEAGTYDIDWKVRYNVDDTWTYSSSELTSVTIPALPDPGAPYWITDLAPTGGDCQYIGTWDQQSKTCTLTSSFSSTSSGIIIGSSEREPNNVLGITIDGAGYTITGPGSSASQDDYGVDARFRDNFTIKNLNIQGFDIGIRTSNGNNGVITGNTLTSNNQDGIYSEQDIWLKITNNIITQNGRNGITLNGGTGSPGSSGGVGVKQNSITLNAGNGIEAFNTSGIWFEQNTAFDNLKGFYLSNNDVNSFVGNTANSNTNNGFAFFGSTNFVFTGDNTATGNGINFECSGGTCDASPDFPWNVSADTTPPTVFLKEYDCDVAGCPFPDSIAGLADIPSTVTISPSSQLDVMQQTTFGPGNVTCDDPENSDTCDAGILRFFVKGRDGHTGTTTPASGPSFSFDYSVACTAVGPSTSNPDALSPLVPQVPGEYGWFTDWEGYYIQLVTVLLPLGTSTVTCSATDAEGNIGTDSFNVTVVGAASGDPTPPGPDTPYTITDNSTGGDCQYIGTWDSGTKTCTLTSGFSSTGTVTDWAGNVRPASGIIIGSNGITIDGAGHTITGSNENREWGNDYGVDASNRDNFTIKNLNIQGFLVGVNVQGYTNDGTITGNTLTSNTWDGIRLGTSNQGQSTQGLKITNNVIQNNDRNGITLNGGVGSPGGCSDYTVKQNTVTSNAGNGIEAYNTSGICIEQNTSNSNLKGFFIGQSSVSNISGNVANSNTNRGFLIEGSTNFVFTGDNTATGNGINFECSGGTCDASPDFPWNVDTILTGNLSLESLTMSSTRGNADGTVMVLTNGTIISGEDAHFVATLTWEGVSEWYASPSDLFDVEAKFGAGTYENVHATQNFNDVNIYSGTATLTWDYYVSSAAGGYPHWVTFTADTGEVFDETDETDNYIAIEFTPQASSTPTDPTQNYTVYVNQMRGSGVIDANEPGGCAGLTPQTCYSPSAVTINSGDSVTWINKDPTNNWYTLMGSWGGLAPPGSDNACDGPGKLAWDMCGGSWIDGVYVQSGNHRTSWTHTFDQVGTYNYHDWVYQNSAQRPEGVVNVVASGAPSPSSQLPVITTQTPGGDTTPPVVNVPSDQTLTATSSSGISQTVSESSWLSSLEAFDVIVNSTGTHSQLLRPTCTTPEFTFNLYHSDWESHFLNYGRTNDPPPEFTGIWWGWAPITSNSGGGASMDTEGCWGCSDQHKLNLPMGTTTLTCSATDYAGNSASGSFNITVVEPGADTTPPVVNVPSDQTLTATSSSGISLIRGDNPVGYFSFVMSASDAVTNSTGTHSQMLIPYCTAPDVPDLWSSAVIEFPIGTTTLTCTATDYAGNTGSASFNVTVIEPGVPTVVASAYTNSTSPTGRTLSLSGHVSDGSVYWLDHIRNGAPYYEAMGYDQNLTQFYFSILKDNTVVLPSGSSSIWFFEFSGDTALTYEGDTVNSGYNLPIPADWEAGTYDIDWKVRYNVDDTWTYSSSELTSVTIPALPAQGDITLPNIVVSENIFAQTTDPTGKTISFTTPSATDDVGVVTLSCNPASGTFFPVGSTTVTCTATDAVGNVGSASFVVNVTYELVDIAEPVFTQVSNESISTTNSTGTTFSYQVPTATDNIGVTVGPTCTPASGSLFPVGSTTVTCTATDAVGNVGAISFNITVINTVATGDTIAPSFATPQDISVEAFVANGAEVTYTNPAATDNEAVVGDPVCTPESGTFFPIGDTIVTCTATDAAGNQGSTQFTISVESTVQEPTDAPTDEVPELSVSSVESITVEGSTVTTLDAGNLGYFETSLTTNSTSSVLVTVSVMSADQTMLGVGFFKSVIGAGQSDIVLGFQIPENTISGIADVYVNVFTDWPELGGILITDEISAQVEIIGVDPSEVATEDTTQAPLESSGLQAIVLLSLGSSTPGCEENDNCFAPSTVIIDSGGTVTWENVNTAAHTVTSGSPSGGPDGVFDSSLLMAGSSFSHTFNQPGTYSYFAMTHPWMQGTVIVEGAPLTEEEIAAIAAAEAAAAEAAAAEAAAAEAAAAEAAAAEAAALEALLNPESSGSAATVQNAPGSSIPGCEETNSCFVPRVVKIDVDGIVTWENLDTTHHTTTSRTISEQGELVGFVWDSGLIASGSSFIHQFDTAGTYDYFCMVHPWMEGTVIVEEELVAESESGLVPEPEPVQIFPSENVALGFDISIPEGGFTPGCEENYSCFSPFAVQIYVGQELTWRNDATSIHFIASGTPSEGLDGIFFSDSLGINEYFSHQFDEAGTYEYYELYHPWMTGIVHVLPLPETMNVTVINALGSSVPGCEETNLCFVPSTVIVDITGTVTWENQDNAMHTVTSGSTGDGFDGVFESGIMFENSDPFSHTFYAPGTYEYYCMIHPWMEGTVIVGAG